MHFLYVGMALSKTVLCGLNDKTGKQKNYFLFYQHLSCLQNSIILFFCMSTCQGFFPLQRWGYNSFALFHSIKTIPFRSKIQEPSIPEIIYGHQNPALLTLGSFPHASTSPRLKVHFCVELLFGLGGRERLVLIVLVGDVIGQLSSIQFSVKGRSKYSSYVLKKWVPGLDSFRSKRLLVNKQVHLICFQ